MVALGVAELGTESLAGEFARADPTVVVTSPSGTVVTSTVTFSFTYSSPVSRAQAQYRAQLRSQDGSSILFDTGTVESSSSTGLALDFVLSGGSGYQIWVQASDGFDWSAFATESFNVESSGVSDFPDEPRVGSVFEVAINGVGYMLSDTPEHPVERRSTVLEPPRFATGDTPFSEAVERYTFVGHSDFEGGAGQVFNDRVESDPTRFRDSEGVNPFDDDCVSLLPATVQSIDDAHTAPHAVVAGGRVYVCTADGELTSQATPEGAETTFSITGGGPVQSMTSDGTNWYFADGDDIFRNDDATDPTTAWSTIDADLVRWCVDRIGAVYDDGTDLCVTTLAPAGTEEVAGGRFKYPNTVQIPDITAGDGYMWFIVNRDETSQVHYWQLGSADTYAAAGLTLPAGQRATALGFYLGSVFVRVVEPLETGYRAIIYRCVPNQGALTPQRVVSWESSTDPSTGGFAGDDRFVAFSWTGMTRDDDYSGLGAIDLSTGGWAKWLNSTATGTVLAPVFWNGRLAFPVVGSGLWVEDETYVTEGWLETPVSDLASDLAKIIDEVSASFDPLPSGGSVSLEYSLDGGTSYTSAGDAVDTAGLTIGTWDIAKRTRSVAVRLTIGGDGAASPCIRFIQTQLHPESLVDQLLVLPINCSDNVAGLNGSTIPSELSGMQRMHVLENLIGGRVRLQDVDWPVTQSATIWDVVDIRAQLTGVFDRTKNRRVDTGFTNVTFRRGT